MDEYSLEPDMGLMKNLEFYLELAQFMDQRYKNLRGIYEYFGKANSFNDKLDSYEVFFDTLTFLTTRCHSDAQN